MRKSFLLVFLLISRIGIAQQNDIDKKEITSLIMQFFVALEKQDSVLFKSISFENAQIWLVQKRRDTLRTSVRTFRDNFQRFNGKNIVHEVPLDIDIKTHGDIAIAWVPYELSVNKKFSHCGVDTFTFLRTMKGWKIVNLSFTVEPDGCGAIKNAYQQKSL